MIQSVAILGSTGSIGISTLDVIARHPDRFSVYALTANSSADKLLEQVNVFAPRYAVLVNPESSKQIEQLRQQTSGKTEWLTGTDALEQVVKDSEVDTVMAAIVGAAGLMPTYAAVKAGKKVLLANKEALVVAGELMMEAAEANAATLLPIDSEHNAIFQCLPHDFKRKDKKTKVGVEKILLTGSGGPFRTMNIEKLASVTPEQACAHPNWSMGRKISVDSATMMNKGLEVIEACHLFGIATEQLEVVLHPQSIIHSMVQYSDGSVLAQMGQPDMRTPIAYGLGWPERVESGVQRLDFKRFSSLDFEQPDIQRYPCLKLAFDAYDIGGNMPAVLNAANEVAVAAFLDNAILFTDIAVINEKVMARFEKAESFSIEALIEVDQQARAIAREFI